VKTPDKVQCAGCGDTLVVHEHDIYMTMDLHEDETIDLDTVKFRCQACASAAGVAQ